MEDPGWQGHAGAGRESPREESRRIDADQCYHCGPRCRTYDWGVPRALTRRQFVTTAAASGGAAAGAAFVFRSPRPIEGRFVDTSVEAGHAIRDGRPFTAPAERERPTVVVVGGGVAGLSAAWRMLRLGFEDFVVLELEDSPGGNSRSGRSPVSAYPWAAHYVPVPDRRIPLVEELFEQLGVLKNGRWDGAHRASEPLSRLYRAGHWTPGIEPGDSAPEAEVDQFNRFWDRMEYYRQGGEFTIPLRPPSATRGLDRISMKTWMVDQGFYHERLRWYVDYACRDDYGCSYDEASAWAGIHYFAARPEDDEGFLTWPEGNGWIVERLVNMIGHRLRTGAAVRKIALEGAGLEVATAESTLKCEAVIVACPVFLARYLMPSAAATLPGPRSLPYSPWYTANLTVDREPREADAPPAWENILYNSPGLGYVIATHQTNPGRTAPSVWTYYRALAGSDPWQGRASLLAKGWQERKEEVLRDLESAHPDIRKCVARIDIMRLGHAMIRPAPGLLSSEVLRNLANRTGPVQFASSDLSGISIFEEAQFRGVRAADRVLTHLGYRDLEYGSVDWPQGG